MGASVSSKRKQIFRCAAIPKCKHEEWKNHPTFNLMKIKKNLRS